MADPPAPEAPAPDSAGFVRVVAAEDIRMDSGRAFDVGGRSVLVCRSKGAVYAVANMCSHAEQVLEGGKVRAGKVVCPIHGARFDLATGAAINPPATKPIVTYPARVVDGWVEVAVG